MASLTGDFGKITALSRRIRSLGSDSSLRQVAGQLSTEALRLTDQEFEQERDPLGSPWAPKKRDDGRPVLAGKSGKLRKGYRKKFIGPRGFQIWNPDAYYRKFVTRGTRYIKAKRAISPGSSVPDRWSRAFRRIWDQHCLLKLSR